eukprot:TRINITY_DN19939_c0_g1_i1.p1 TRINITY_DN19939_c0_g1~~TRINITY_DN19939_c0_g1_i1.p1  ORF type:complete len:921 (+),score=252.59 TRINITY_DN19939_c0_g1_i1:23-2764(+)
MERSVVSSYCGIYQCVDGEWQVLYEFGCVWLTINFDNKIYRIIAKSATKNDKFVLNYTLSKSVTVRKEWSFVCWYDTSGPVLGLTFHSPSTSLQFYEQLKKMIISLGSPTFGLDFEAPSIQTPDVKSPKPTSSKANNELKKHLMKKLFDFESFYHQNLQILSKYWFERIKLKKISTEEIEDIFSKSFSSILDSNQILIKELIKNQYDNYNKKKIALILIDTIPDVSMYKIYAENFLNALETVEKLKSKKSSFFKKCEESLHGFYIEFFLYLPLEQISFYTTFLIAYLECTSADSKEYIKLQEMKQNYEQVKNYLDQNVLNQSRTKLMRNLLNRNYHGLDSLITSNRYLVFEGPLLTTVMGVECNWILLFNDMLAFVTDGKAEKQKKRQIHVYFQHSIVWMQRMNDVGDDVFFLKTPEAELLVRTVDFNETKKATAISSISNLSASKLWYERIRYHINLWISYQNSQSILMENNNFEERYAEYKFKDGSMYKGHWLNAKIHGKGILESSNGTVIEGNFERGFIQGFGKAVYAEATYEGEWSEDLPHGNGTLSYTNGTTYSGEWVNGRKIGQGKIVWPNGDSYVGSWNNDKMDGKGILSRKNPPSFYEGDLKDDLKNGIGTLKLKNYRYTGEWLNDLQHGKGEESTPDYVYTGFFRRGRKEGEGKWHNTDNTINYEGQFLNDQFHGSGKYQNSTIKYTYEGDWICGKKNGKGKESWGDGRKYDGYWENDLYEGKGLFSGKTGEIYDGFWHCGKKYGYGKMVYSNTDTYEGEWFADRKEGQGTFRCHDESWYTGYWLDDFPHGEGEYHYTEGYYYIGQFSGGLRHGVGTLTTPKGSFSGNWQNGLKQGKGTFTEQSGILYEGEWLNNQKHGNGTRKLNKEANAITEEVWTNGKQTSPGIKYYPPELPDLPLHWNNL